MDIYRHPLPRKVQDVFLTRDQVLSTCIVTSLGTFLFLLPGFPFNRLFCALSFVSFCFHLLIFLFFRRMTPLHFSVASLINLVMLGFAIHYTGGILSPYTLVFAMVLISSAYYGIKYRLALVVAFLIYISVIVSEAMGWWPPLDIRPADVYRSWPTTLLIVVTIAGLMMITDSIYKITMKYLRQELEKEMELNQAMRDQIVHLEAPSQVGLVVNKIVHDLRGPLGAISGFIKMIRSDNQLSPESQEDCAVMLTEIDRIGNLVNRMLKYVRPGDTKRHPVCPVDLLETVIAVMSFYPGARRVTFEKSFPPADQCSIFANKEELQQVIFNLLKNSIEALESVKSPVVRLAVIGTDEHVFLTVEDNGPGIDPGVINRLGSDSVSTKKDGAGVGLIIAKEIIAAHGGSLDLRGDVGRGTVATIRLPRVISGKQQRKEDINQS